MDSKDITACFKSGNYDKFMEYYNKYDKNDKNDMNILNSYNVLFNNILRDKLARYDINKLRSKPSVFTATLISVAIAATMPHIFINNPKYSILPPAAVLFTFLGYEYYINHKNADLVKNQIKILKAITPN
jgi:hypothetical protein